MAATPTKALNAQADYLGARETKTSSASKAYVPLQSPIKASSVARVASSAPATWYDLGVGPFELRPCASLATGQCFNWRPVQFASTAVNEVASNEVAWVGVVGSQVLALRETPTTTMFACLADQVRKHWLVCGRLCSTALLDQMAGILVLQDDATSGDNSASTAAARAALRDLFQVDTALAPLVASWSSADPRLKAIAPCLPGLRVLRQEPVECLVSFIVRFTAASTRVPLRYTPEFACGLF